MKNRTDTCLFCGAFSINSTCVNCGKTSPTDQKNNPTKKKRKKPTFKKSKINTLCRQGYLFLVQTPSE